MPTWIFDLDNTLHDAEPYVFPEMNRRMTEYMACHLGLPHAEADALRTHYWDRYGATLCGLMRHAPHLDPAHFLRETHKLPDLARELRPVRALRATLKRLPGRKLLYTNGQLEYAVTVLRELRVAHLFDGIVSIEHGRFRPKPQTHGYRWLLRRYRLDPRRCVMVEDTRDNLLTAKRLGLATVWLTRQLKRGPGVDLAVRELSELPRRRQALPKSPAKSMR
jgi:putative hydrolase of the HAD superfamily